jgi:hypothetical protein
VKWRMGQVDVRLHGQLARVTLACTVVVIAVLTAWPCFTVCPACVCPSFCVDVCRH